MSPQYRTPRYSAPRRRSSASVGQIACSITSSTSLVAARTARASTRPCRRCSGPGRRRTRACGPAPARTAARRVRRTARTPTARDRSCPLRSRTCGPASPNASPDRYARTASRASASRLGDDHALARGEPVGLHDVQAAAASRGTRTRRSSLTGAERAVPRRSAPRPRRARPSSTPWSLRACAAAAVGPNARRPGAVERVDDTRRRAVPRARPRRDRRRARRRARRPRAGIGRVDRHGTRPARPCPGCRARRRPRRPSGERASPHASACSRPPAPTTRTRAHLRGAGQHDGLIACRADTDEARRARRGTPRRTARSRAPRRELLEAARRRRSRVPQPGNVSYTGRTLCSTDWWYGTCVVALAVFVLVRDAHLAARRAARARRAS